MPALHLFLFLAVAALLAMGPTFGGGYPVARLVLAALVSREGPVDWRERCEVLIRLTDVDLGGGLVGGDGLPTDISRTWTDGTVASVVTERDRYGRELSRTTPSGVDVASSYSASGRLLSQDLTWATGSWSVASSFDAFGLQSGWSATRPMGDSLTLEVERSDPATVSSTTKDPAVAMEKYGEHGVVAIDASKVTGEVVDLSGGIPNGGRMSNWAAADQEVLIQGAPADALTRIK